MGRGTLGEVREGLENPQGGPGQFGGTSGWSGTGLGPTRKSRTLPRTLGEVRDGSGDPRGGPGPVEGPSGRSGMGRGKLPEVGDMVGGPSVRSGTVG